ncbi:MAG: hypothetical protein ACI4SD_03415, partial [Suilimivivens sp.]
MIKKKTNAQNVGGEKRLNAIWIVLAIISFMFLVGTAFGHVDELSLRSWGHSFDAKFIEDENGVYAEYVDENEELHTFNLGGHSPVHDGDKITMYYATDIDDALPQNTLSSWLLYYVIYGVVFGISMWQIRKVTHP